MPVLPRIDDRLELRRDPAKPGGFRIYDTEGRDCGPLAESGRFLVLRLDGISERSELQAAYQASFDRVLGDHELDSLIGWLREDRLLNENPRALGILGRLKHAGISYRSTERDRREGDRGDRRQGAGFSAAFDHGVMLLNEGLLELAKDVFQRLASGHPTDLRLQQILGHLEFVLAQEKNPDLKEDRRDVDWVAFDRALGEMLDRGVCPRCDEDLVVELGRTNHCDFCGASFTTFALDRKR